MLFGAKLGNLSLLCRPSPCGPPFLHHHRDAFPGCGAHLAPASLICARSSRSLGARTVAAQCLKRGNCPLNSSLFASQIPYKFGCIHLSFPFHHCETRYIVGNMENQPENAQGQEFDTPVAAFSLGQVASDRRQC